MKITVCIGSSCHIKGSRQVVEGLQKRINEHQLSDRVQLNGTFCLGDCQRGVCVKVDDRICSVSPDEIDAFFQQEVLANLK